MNQFDVSRPVPPDMKAALCIIGDWASRDELSPCEVIDIFNDGFVQRHVRLHAGLAQAPASIAQAAPDSIAGGLR